MTTLNDPSDGDGGLGDVSGAETPLDGAAASIQTPRDSPRAGLGLGHVTQDRIGALVLERLFERKAELLRIGRFSVLERIGRGGMGTVYAAYDEQLDRKIAIKIIGSQDFVDDMARHRLEREAQAMARLSHPNVVTVHEVGDHEGEVFVAMEFIRGQSLAEWIHTKPDWREVLDTFIQAGRGLVAAHEAGLVHRDLKPHNIMRTDEGIVKVLDFGLARAADDDDEASDEVDDRRMRSDSGASAFAVDLTRTGAVLGTPAYMAPEQHRGEPADARSDQFSLCVALYEALYRRRPFDAPTAVAIAHRVLSGDLEPPPADSRVPTWVHRIVVRGLRAKPSERWPSMRAVVEALERDPTRARRRWLTVAGLGILTGLAGFGLADLRGGGPPPCAPADSERQALWSVDRHDRIAVGWREGGSPLAEDTLPRVTGRVDAYVDALGSMRHEVCESHRSGSQSSRLFDLRSACLDARRAGLDELLTELERGDAATVQNAAWAAASLPRITVCGDTEALLAAVPPPEDPEVAAQVQAEREGLASTTSLVLAGSYEQASARAEASLRRAEALEYPPLRAEAELGLGTALMESHQHQPAYEALSRGIVEALRSGHDEVAVEALARRMWVVADPLRRPSDALADDEIADALAHKLGRPTRLQWLLLNNRGVALFRSGRLGEAERSYRDALVVVEEAGAQSYPVELISTRFNLAMLLSEGLGRPDEAAKELDSARVQTIELLGPDHPRVVVFSSALATQLLDAGRHDRALPLLDAGLARLSSADVYLRAMLLLERANLHAYVRRDAAALEDAAEALALADAAFPDDHLRSVGLWSRGTARVGLGDLEAGVEDLREAVALDLQHVGPEHEFVAKARWWAGRGLLRAGRIEDAIVELEQAREIFAGLGPSAPSHLGRHAALVIEARLEHGDLARADELLREAYRAQDEAGISEDSTYRMALSKREGDLRMAHGDIPGALVAYERACRRFEEGFDPTDPELAACRFALARALGSTARARTLAEQALAAYRSLGEGFAGERAQLEAFLVGSPDRPDPSLPVEGGAHAQVRGGGAGEHDRGG